MTEALRWDEASVLRDRGLLPVEIGDRFDLTGSPDQRSDRYRGALVGLGIGNALGRTVDGWSSDAVRRRLGDLDAYPSRPNVRWLLPAGHLGDQAQAAILVAATIVANGTLEPDDLAQRLTGWLPVARTPDETTRLAVSAMRNGSSWLGAGVESNEAGAAVRGVPIGLAGPIDADDLRRGAVLATVATHKSAPAAAASVVTAALIGHLVDGPERVDGMGRVIEQALGGMPEEDVVRPLRERLDIALDLAGGHPDDALVRIGNGPSVDEALPLALWALASSPDDPMRAIRAALLAGGSTSITATLAGSLAGARHGLSAFPSGLVEDLEYADGLIGYADDLQAVSGVGAPGRDRVARDPLHPATHAPFRLGGVVMPTLEHAIRSTAASDPGKGVRLRLLPTPADTRRAASTTETRADWDSTAARAIGAVLRRRFDESSGDAAELRDRADHELEALVHAFPSEEPFDYPVLLALRRDELGELLTA